MFGLNKAGFKLKEQINMLKNSSSGLVTDFYQQTSVVKNNQPDANLLINSPFNFPSGFTAHVDPLDTLLPKAVEPQQELPK